MNVLLEYFVVLWGLLMIVFLGIGGFFMFRKFLKQIPKEDGHSEMDWQHYFIDQTRHMWKDEELSLLNELVAPVPELFRDVARQTIASKIGELALQENSDVITQDILSRDTLLVHQSVIIVFKGKVKRKAKRCHTIRTLFRSFQGRLQKRLEKPQQIIKRHQITLLS